MPQQNKQYIRDTDNSAIFNCFRSSEDLQFRTKSASFSKLYQQPRPNTLNPDVSTSMSNISKSNRLIIENVRKQIQEARAKKSDGSINQHISKLPGSDIPVYVFDDETRPNLLQRSKSFVVDRAASIRKSFRTKKNTPVQDPPRISLVFNSDNDAQATVVDARKQEQKQDIKKYSKGKSKSKSNKSWFRFKKQSET